MLQLGFDIKWAQTARTRPCCCVPTTTSLFEIAQISITQKTKGSDDIDQTFEQDPKQQPNK